LGQALTLTQEVKDMKSQMNQAPGNWIDSSLSFEEALARLPEALKKEGFGVITQIDMQETLKAKLGVAFPRYRIFGACNPSLAHQALLENPEIGVLLPCNVVLFEREDGRVRLGAVDPMQTLGAAAGPGLNQVAGEVAARLGRVLQELRA
jgi:uncharacterized protein (DUF302 family)